MQTGCWEYSTGLNQKAVEQLLNSNLVYQSYFINSDVMLTHIKAFSNSDVDTEVFSHEGIFFFLRRCFDVISVSHPGNKPSSEKFR